MNLILTFISAGAAISSVYYAFKTTEQNRMSQMPVLSLKMLSASDPHVLEMTIENIGNGIAKNIKARVLPIDVEVSFGSDLVPRKYQDYIFLTLKQIIDFENGNNPLFGGEVLFTYEDIFNKKYSMRACFKPDADQSRKNLGHIDVNFQGLFY